MAQGITFPINTVMLEKASSTSFSLNSPGLSFAFSVKYSYCFSQPMGLSKPDTRIISTNKIWTPEPQTATQGGTGLKGEI